MSPTDVYTEFRNVLSNRNDAFYVWRRGGDHYNAVYKVLDDGDVERHVKGAATLSLPALSAANTCKWIGFDFDSADGNADRVEEVLRSNDWSYLRDSKREGKDGHVLVLLDTPCPGLYVRRFAGEILQRAGLEEGGKIEVYPKSPILRKNQKLGSALRMPIGVNQKPSAAGARGWIDGVERDIEAQILYLISSPRNPSKKLSEIAVSLLKRDEDQATSKFNVNNYTRPKRPERALCNFLDFITDRREIPSGYSAPCPCCRAEGRDRSGDNLWISDSGKYVKCWRDDRHDFKAIILASGK